MSSRPILKASRPTKEVPELTGRENLKYVEPNRIYNYGYKYFLYLGKIQELFGERVAKSKKIRKAKIREILKKIMHTFDLKEDFTENAVVDDFIKRTEDKLRTHVAEIQAMQSSPMDANLTVTVKKIEKIKRKKDNSKSNEMRDNIMKVDEPSPAKQELNPLENQIDFLADLMKSTTDPSKKPTLTVRQVEAKFRVAQQKDQDAMKKALVEKERQEKQDKRRRVMELNKEIRDDLTILLERSGI